MASNCPCGTGQPYEMCCQPLHLGRRHAKTAEELMRSRYSAYVMEETAYLLDTWHPDTRPPVLSLEQDVQWRELRVLAREKGVAGDTEGRVTFVARYKIHGKAFKLQENSRFTFENGQWYYVDGDTETR